MTNGRKCVFRRRPAKKFQKNENRLNTAAFTVLEFGEIKAGAGTGPHLHWEREEGE